MLTKNNFLGADGLVWWMGVVENRKDPLNLGRCQVRVVGWHTENLQLIPSADLPWAHPIIPVNTSNVNKSPKEGDYVIGLFFDGPSGQFPGYFGVVPGIPTVSAISGTGFADQRTSAQVAASPSYLGNAPTTFPNRLGEPTTSRLYRNENATTTVLGKEIAGVVTSISAADGSTWSQPTPSYNAVPPYNDVKETESGHVMEFDDTPGYERVHVAHRTGTYTEMRPDGSKVTRVVGNNYEVVAGNDYVNIQGVCNITVNGNANIKVGGVLNTTVGSNMNLNVGGSFNVNGNMNLKGNLNQTGNINQNGNQNVSGTVTAGGFNLN